jgi:hypothetical protein
MRFENKQNGALPKDLLLGDWDEAAVKVHIMIKDMEVIVAV